MSDSHFPQIVNIKLKTVGSHKALGVLKMTRFPCLRFWSIIAVISYHKTNKKKATSVFSLPGTVILISLLKEIQIATTTTKKNRNLLARMKPRQGSYCKHRKPKQWNSIAIFCGLWAAFLRNKIVFVSVDGGYDEWGNYSECSLTCGGGNQMRMRTCTNPVPQNGGNPCMGVHSQTRECNTQACPGAYVTTLAPFWKVIQGGYRKLQQKHRGMFFKEQNSVGGKFKRSLSCRRWRESPSLQFSFYFKILGK